MSDVGVFSRPPNLPKATTVIAPPGTHAVADGEFGFDPRLKGAQQRFGDIGQRALAFALINGAFENLHAHLEFAVLGPAPRQVQDVFHAGGVLQEVFQFRAHFFCAGRFV